MRRIPRRKWRKHQQTPWGIKSESEGTSSGSSSDSGEDEDDKDFDIANYDESTDTWDARR